MITIETWQDGSTWINKNKLSKRDSATNKNGVHKEVKIITALVIISLLMHTKKMKKDITRGLLMPRRKDKRLLRVLL